MRYIDIHSHIQFPEYDTDRDAVIARMKDGDVATIAVGTDLASSRAAVELASKHDNVYACIGLHPADDASENSERFSGETLAAFEELVKNPKVVAIGECGLDSGRAGDRPQTERDRQREDFLAQIDFAIQHDKPLMLHCRSAHEDVLDILEKKRVELLAAPQPELASRLRGNSHFFTASNEIAQRYFAIGFTVSFTGVLTFTHDYDEVLKSAPLDMIMSETDSPFVAPVPYRGSRNEPAHVVEVAKAIAKIRGEDEEVVRKALIENAKRMFGASL